MNKPKNLKKLNRSKKIKETTKNLKNCVQRLVRSIGQRIWDRRGPRFENCETRSKIGRLPLRIESNRIFAENDMVAQHFPSNHRVQRGRPYWGINSPRSVHTDPLHYIHAFPDRHLSTALAPSSPSFITRQFNIAFHTYTHALSSEATTEKERIRKRLYRARGYHNWGHFVRASFILRFLPFESRRAMKSVRGITCYRTRLRSIFLEIFQFLFDFIVSISSVSLYTGFTEFWWIFVSFPFSRFTINVKNSSSGRRDEDRSKADVFDQYITCYVHFRKKKSEL